MNERCACGAGVCPNRNRAWFYRTEPALHRRAVVFWWPVRSAWTWCPVLDGRQLDDGYVMGHYDTVQLAWADANAWTRGEYGEVRR